MFRLGYMVIVVIPNDMNKTHALTYDYMCRNYNLNMITAAYPVSTCIEQIDILEVFDSYDEIFKLLEREKPDLIHSVQINATVELVSRKLHIPHLMNIYQADLEEFEVKWMDILPQYHSADSELLAGRWGEGLHIPSRCLRVAYENNKDIKAIRKDVTFLKILSIGILAEIKNQLEIIKFVSICKENGIEVELTVLGNYDTPYGRTCIEFVKHNKLEHQVIFKGFVQNVEEYFAQADLMILASTVESFPGVIVESMANRVAIITTPVAGIPEILDDEQNCFFTKGYCAEDIYEAFIRYLKYKRNGELQKIVKHAYDTYKQNHSYEAIGSKLELYYRWIWENYNERELRIGIEEVKQQFSDFLKEKNLEAVGKYTLKNVWFLYHINNMVRQNMFHKIVIWGAGEFGKVALEWIKILECESRLIGYIDIYKTGEYLGYPILEEKEQVVKSCDMVLVAIGDTNSCLEVMAYLEQCGKRRNKDYFLILNNPIRI